VLHARVVHEDVHGPEPGLGLGDEIRDLRGLRHVGAVIERLDAVLLLEPRAQRLDLGRVTESVQHHVRALAREGLGDAPADAARRSRDDRAHFPSSCLAMRFPSVALQACSLLFAAGRSISTCGMPSSM
jgi:hypothetical protein